MKTFLLLVTGISLTSTALASYPTFLIPSAATVQQLVSDQGCKTNEAKIPQDSKIAINNPRFPITQTWYWQYNGDGQCQQLPQNVDYLSYEQTGITAGNQIISNYGFADHIDFSFVFTVPAEWECSVTPYFGQLPLVSCSQDMLSA